MSSVIRVLVWKLHSEFSHFDEVVEIGQQQCRSLWRYSTRILLKRDASLRQRLESTLTVFLYDMADERLLKKVSCKVELWHNASSVDEKRGDPREEL